MNKLPDITPQMEQILRDGLNPTALEIINDSARHHGHAGDNHTGQSHFIINITSGSFAGKTRVQQHQLIYQLLSPFMPNPIHALQLSCKVG